MDQLEAYRILGIEPDSSPEKIKEAYATLSKQYHPEENPEKFQEIHEAYITLIRRKRHVSVKNVHQEIQEPEKIEKEYDFDKIEMQHNTHKVPEYSFEEAMQKAKQEEQAKSHELVLEATAEFKVLVSSKYKSQLKSYRALFEDKKYESIIRRADFLEKLCNILEETKLKKNIYNYIIDFYRLRGKTSSELSQIGMRLYRILDERAGIKKEVNPGIYGGIVAGILAGFRALRPIARGSQIVATIALCIIVAFFLILIAKKLREKHSLLFAQAAIAIGIMISQFVVIMFDIYGTAFGTVDDGNTIAAIIFMAASIWLLIVIVVSIIKGIKNVIKGK